MPTETDIPGLIAAFPALATMQTEHVLDMEPFPIFEVQGDAEILDLPNYIKILGNDIEKQVSDLPIAIWLQLYAMAYQLKPAGLNGYVTGLRIKFGIDANNMFKAAYQPVCLGWLSGNAGAEALYAPIDGNIYFFDAGTGKLVLAQEGSNIFNYKQKIRIKHMGQAVHSPYVPGDVLSLIFPFQEIFSLIVDHPGLASLQVYNSVRKTAVPAGTLIQHAMLLSPNLGPPIVSGFYGKYGNRASLCPPDCDTKFLRAPL